MRTGRLQTTLLFCLTAFTLLGCGLSEPTAGPSDSPETLQDHSAASLYPIATGNRWVWKVNVYGSLTTEFTTEESIGGLDSLRGKLGYIARDLVIVDGDTTHDDTLHYAFQGDTLLEAPVQPAGWFRVLMGVEDLAVGDTLKIYGLRGAYAQYLGDHHAISSSPESFHRCVLLRYHDSFHLSETDYYFKPGVGIVRIDGRYYEISYGPREPYQTRVYALQEYEVH